MDNLGKLIDIALLKKFGEKTIAPLVEAIGLAKQKIGDVNKMIGDVDLTKGDLQTQVSELTKQIGTDGEIHGAIVLVTTYEESLITKTVTLSKDDTVIETKQFDSNGKCIFVNIQEQGDYVVSASDGSDSTSEIVTITSDNIVNKTVVSCEISLTPVGATVTPVDDVTVLLKCADIKSGFTTMDQVLSDSNTMYLITSNENSMQYLARSTGFADAVCANETFMTYLGQSPYVDDTILNSDLWKQTIKKASQYWSLIYTTVYTIHAGVLETITIDGVYGSFTTNSDGTVNHALPLGELTLTGSVSNQSFTRTITKETTDIYVMQENSLYWYGNECIEVTGGFTKGYYQVESTYEMKTNEILINLITGATLTLCTNNKVSTIGMSSLKAFISANSTNTNSSTPVKRIIYIGNYGKDQTTEFGGVTRTTVQTPNFNAINEIQEVNISEYQSEYYAHIGVTGYYGTNGTMNIYALWLE